MMPRSKKEVAQRNCRASDERIPKTSRSLMHHCDLRLRLRRINRAGW